MPTGHPVHGKLGRIQIGLPQNCIITLTFSGVVTGGTFTLTFNAVTTGNIAYSLDPSVTAANIQTALAALSTILLGNVGVFAFPSAPPYIFTIYLFNGLGLASQPAMTINVGGLTGGGSGALTFSSNTSVILLTGKSHEPTDDYPEADVTNFESGGALGLAGIPRLVVAVNAFFDGVNNPQASPPGLVRTDSGPPHTFFTGRYAPYRFAFFIPISRIKNIKVPVPVDNAVQFNYEVGSQGGYVDSAGSVVTI